MRNKLNLQFKVSYKLFWLGDSTNQEIIDCSGQPWKQCLAICNNLLQMTIEVRRGNKL